MNVILGYDEWLEIPYEIQAEYGVEYERFCEERDFDPDDPESEAAYWTWLGEPAE